MPARLLIACPGPARHRRGGRRRPAHFVTEALDAGPILEQDVVHVSHRDDVAAPARLGRDVERQVLARAVGAVIDDRVLVHEGRTVVF